MSSCRSRPSPVRINGHSVCDCSKTHKDVAVAKQNQRNFKTRKGFKRYVHYRDVAQYRRPLGRAPPVFGAVTRGTEP